MRYFLYLVRCANNSLYCGITTDIERRIKEHNSLSKKSAKYTRANGPVILLYKEECENLSAALKREFEVKKLKKSQKEALINSV